MVLISYKRHGFQTTDQYSKIGLTYTLKADMSDSTLFDWKHRSNKLDHLWAFKTYTIYVIYAANFKL